MNAARTVAVRDVVLGGGRTAIIAPLTGATERELRDQLRSLDGLPVDIVEWRVDLFSTHDPDAVRTIARELAREHPLLATVRTRAEGGAAPFGAELYRDLVVTLLDAGVIDAIDVEYRRDGAGVLVRLAHERGVPVVASFHNFELTPPRAELVDHFAAMHALDAEVLKLAVMPHSPADVLTLLDAAREAHERHGRPLVAIAMGELGRVTRIAGSLVGSAATFGSAGADSAPGQLPVRELRAALDLLED